MYKNGVIKWAENGFSEQLKECFDKYDNGILSGENDELDCGGFWDLAKDMYLDNQTGMEQDSIYYLLVDYYERVKHNKTKEKK